MSERGGAIWNLLAAIGLVVVLLAVLFAVCLPTGGTQPARVSVGRVVLVSHRGECDPDWGDCGGDYYGGQGNRNDQRRCRGDQCRGSFSPGPFDRSPVDVHDNCVSLDCSSGGQDKKKNQPPPQQQPKNIACLVPVPYHCDGPRSLFPPSIDGVKNFVTATIKSGIDLGRTFADTTITFVENLMMGLA
jgi:hypothetical protein